MNYSTFRFSLDFHKHQSQISIAVFQYDTAVRLCISLTDGGMPYLVENGCVAVFYGKRPDGTPLTHYCAIEGNSRIIYDFQDSTAAVAGITDCQIRLYDKDHKLVTAPRFIIVVEERSVRELDIEVEDDKLSAIDAMIFAEQERADAETGRQVAENQRKENEAQRKALDATRDQKINDIAFALIDKVSVVKDELVPRDFVYGKRGNGETTFTVRDGKDNEGSVQGTGQEIIIPRYNERGSISVSAEANFDTINDTDAVPGAMAKTIKATMDYLDLAFTQVDSNLSNLLVELDGTYAKQSDISKVYRYCGSYEYWFDLEDEIQYNGYEPQNGDVVSIEQEEVFLNGNTYPKGTNFAYSNGHWDALGGALDGYATKHDIENLVTEDDLNTRVSKIDEITDEGKLYQVYAARRNDTSGTEAKETTLGVTGHAIYEGNITGCLPQFNSNGSFEVLREFVSDPEQGIHEIQDFEPNEYDAVNKHWTEKTFAKKGDTSRFIGVFIDFKDIDELVADGRISLKYGDIAQVISSPNYPGSTSFIYIPDDIGEMYWAPLGITSLFNYYTKTEIDSLIGGIEEELQMINEGGVE